MVSWSIENDGYDNVDDNGDTKIVSEDNSQRREEGYEMDVHIENDRNINIWKANINHKGFTNNFATGRY